MSREDVWRIRDDRTLSWAAKLVWLMLESRGEDCRPSVAVIAADCGITKPTVRKARAELVAGGWLKESTAVSAAGDADSNSYLVTTPRWGGQPPYPPPPDDPRSETGGQPPYPPGWSTSLPTVGKDVDQGGQPPFPKEEKGRVKGKSKKTSSSDRGSDDGPDARGKRPEVDRICDHLADRVQQLTGRRPPITVTGWLRPARYLLDVDGLDEQKIHQAIEFAAKDEFWAPNIRSVSKLRDKLPQLRAAALRRARGGGGNRHQQNAAATEAYLAAVGEYENRDPERKAISS